MNYRITLLQEALEKANQYKSLLLTQIGLLEANGLEKTADYFKAKAELRFTNSKITEYSDELDVLSKRSNA